MLRNVFENKVVVCIVIATLLLVPLGLIGNLVHERQQRQVEVEADIARSAAGPQQLGGPVLVVPCTETFVEWLEPAADGTRKERKATADCTSHVLPARLAITGNAETEMRRRGIYEALVYTSALKLAGRFDYTPPRPRHPDGTLRFERAYVAVGLSDPRGLAGAPRLEIDQHEAPFEPGTDVGPLEHGIHAHFDLGDATRDHALEFTVDLRLRGMRALEFLPLGRDTKITMKSSWPNPSFIGNQLPIERDVGADGFRAGWATTYLATDAATLFNFCLTHPGNYAPLAATAFGVSFLPAVDGYLKSERATKYGILFVGITFVTLWLIEVLKRLKVHPLQYLMVGVALAVFFLLVLALSEHLGFLTAYAAASTACIALITFYLNATLRDRRLAGAVCALLTTLYGLLYGLLSSEDYALLLGSLVVFALLTMTMVLTRNVDWYRLGAAARQSTGAGVA